MGPGFAKVVEGIKAFEPLILASIGVHFGVSRGVIRKCEEVPLTSKADGVDWTYWVSVYELVRLACSFLRVVAVVDFRGFRTLTVVTHVFCGVVYVVDLQLVQVLF